MTVNDYIDNVSARFAAAELHFGHGTGNARDEAIYLIYSVLDIDFSIDSSALQHELSQAQFKSIEELVLKRVTQKIPVAYLIEEALLEELALEQVFVFVQVSVISEAFINPA